MRNPIPSYSGLRLAGAAHDLTIRMMATINDTMQNARLKYFILLQPVLRKRRRALPVCY